MCRSTMQVLRTGQTGDNKREFRAFQFCGARRPSFEIQEHLQMTAVRRLVTVFVFNGFRDC